MKEQNVKCSGAIFLLALLVPLVSLRGAEREKLRAAASAITEDQAKEYVNYLADDTLEGRAAGSRGGRAAAHYIIDRLEKLKVQPAGVKGGYLQPFGAGCSNILATLEGSDPELKKQYILIGAHYDHVGYGKPNNSFGPLGQIHNGADDNASGVSGLLEIVEACTKLEEHPKRSILFCFWDGEENGLLGSKHWVGEPTVPVDKIAFVLNVDMIGRLRNETAIVYGGRTASGLRQFASEQNDTDMALDFSWDIRPDSDHYTFVNKKIPFLMVFTGLHGDYHRPTDDADKINSAGVAKIAHLLFNMLITLADEPSLPAYRQASSGESAWSRTTAERPLPNLPPRLGIGLDEKQAADGRLIITRVDFNSPAAKADLKLGDQILKIADRDVNSLEALHLALCGADSPVKMLLQREKENEPRELSVELAGAPMRLGFSWRVDEAEPGEVMINRVVPGSPAATAGIRPRDRVQKIGGRTFASGEEFGELSKSLPGPIELVVETAGQIKTIVVHPTDEKASE